jgi:hypothetical protein
MSEDSLGCHKWGEGELLLSLGWGEAKEANIPGQSPTAKNDLAPNVSSARNES